MLQKGVWRNKAGAELRLLGPLMAVGEFQVLGDIWEAQSVNHLFAPVPYLVTEQSMKDSGYELVTHSRSE